jgi:hypothetical protein
MAMEKKRRNLSTNILVYANMQRRGKSMLLAICDAELLGKVLRDGKIVFEVRETFYRGIKMSAEEAVDLVGQSTIVNMIGPHIIQEALERKLIHPEAILKISGIPHAQIVKM